MNREAAAYWMPAFTVHDGLLFLNLRQANVPIALGVGVTQHQIDGLERGNYDDDLQ